MSGLEFPANFRWATIDDAGDLARLVNMAGDGLPYYLWSQLAEKNQSPWEIGEERARRDTGSFSYANTVVREEGNQIVSCLIGYLITEPLSAEGYDALPEMFVPLQKLEDQVVGSWYINVLATYPDYRNKGYGQDFLSLAEDMARENFADSLSLIVADSNPGAIRFYLNNGFGHRSQLPMTKDNWENPGKYWKLMTREIIK